MWQLQNINCTSFIRFRQWSDRAEPVRLISSVLLNPEGLYMVRKIIHDSWSSVVRIVSRAGGGGGDDRRRNSRFYEEAFEGITGWSKACRDYRNIKVNDTERSRDSTCILQIEKITIDNDDQIRIHGGSRSGRRSWTTPHCLPVAGATDRSSTFPSPRSANPRVSGRASSILPSAASRSSPDRSWSTLCTRLYFACLSATQPRKPLPVKIRGPQVRTSIFLKLNTFGVFKFNSTKIKIKFNSIVWINPVLENRARFVGTLICYYGSLIRLLLDRGFLRKSIFFSTALNKRNLRRALSHPWNRIRILFWITFIISFWHVLNFS